MQSFIKSFLKIIPLISVTFVENAMVSFCFSFKYSYLYERSSTKNTSYELFHRLNLKSYVHLAKSWISNRKRLSLILFGITDLVNTPGKRNSFSDNFTKWMVRLFCDQLQLRTATIKTMLEMSLFVSHLHKSQRIANGSHINPSPNK